MNFTKMHGIGNDYIYFDCTKRELADPSELAIKLSDRHFSIGGDGIVLIMPSILCDFKMRMFNNDGSEAEMCGNAIRCVGKYVYEKGLHKGNRVTIETRAGVKTLELFIEDDKVISVRVDMGKPILDPKLIPVTAEENEFILQTEKYEFDVTCVSMGNPHAVIYVDETDFAEFFTLGAEIECHRAFPAKTNVEFVKLIDRNNIQMRVYERGTGETLACGTGACASFVATYNKGLIDNGTYVQLKGGDLYIEMSENGHVFMTGTADIAFEGEVEI
ncbi:MAG: diaminopimelate epimerase [Bacillota bacterium]